jgi:VIT1/CCC1 family predicted Fe2+/Mn2+ transporter
VQFTFLSVLVALLITGSLSGHISGGSKTRATLRVVIGGALAMAITFGIGHLFGVSGL